MRHIHFPATLRCLAGWLGAAAFGPAAEPTSLAGIPA